MSNFSFSKASRLITKDDFLRMRRNSRKIVTNSLIFFFKENELGFARIGFAISKKIGKANVRNTYKRVVREQFRYDLTLRKRSLDILVVGKRSNLEKEKLKVELKFSYNQFIKRLNDK